MPPKSRTKSTTEKTAAITSATTKPTKEVYFLSLNEHFVDAICDEHYHEGDNLLYSVPLGELTPDDAKTIERYGRSFKWAKDCGDPTVKKIIVDACGGNVIFTDDAADRWDIELNGELCNDHNIPEETFCRQEETLTLITHTVAEKSVGELSEALSRFNTDDLLWEEADARKHTRHIMNLCIEAAKKLRAGQPLSLPAEVIPEPLIESPPAQTESASATNRKPRGLAERTELILAEYDRRVACCESSTATSLLYWWQKLPRDKKSGIDEHQKSFNKVGGKNWESNAIKNIQKMIRDYRTGKK